MKNKNIKKPMREIKVVPRATVSLANGEAARVGEAALTLNMREREQSLQVTGKPATVGQVTPGDRLLTVVDDHVITARDGMVLLDGGHAVRPQGDIVGVHAIGPLVVVVGSEGIAYLKTDDDGWREMDPQEAVPQLSFAATVNTVTADIAAVQFAAPYSQWRAPLADADRTVLAGLLRSAWNALNSDSRADGYRTAPVLARWAVRLLDGSYLWMSEPVRVGDETLANADRVEAVVTGGSGGFTGTQQTVMTLRRYTIGISLTRAIPAEWQPLVAGIDVLVTDEAQLLSTSGTLDYRCLTRTTGTRECVLEMGLSRRGDAAISRELAASRWTLLATAPATALPGSGDFAAPVQPLTLTAAQCETLATPLRLTDVVCSTAAGGRLYCCTAAGEVVVTAPGNALVEAHRRSVLGVTPMAMTVVTRPLYSGGFGRYPVYVFSDDGIYAIPQSATGTLGEARLIDRTVIAAGVPPVEAGRDVWLLSRHGHLCRLSGAQLSVATRDAGCVAMAWCNAQEELWLLRPAGNPVVLLPSGAMSERTVDAAQLYSDARHALAVTRTGEMLDLEQEQPAMMPVVWQSHPIALHPLMGERIGRVVWHLTGGEVSLTLQVTGQRGVMAQDTAVNTMTVTGEVPVPLASPAVAWRMRTLRLDLTGEARTGTLLLPTLLCAC